MHDKILAAASALLLCALPALSHDYDGHYEGKALDHIAYPIGGLGSGMFCLEGTGAISNVSFIHYPRLFHEPCTFAAIHLEGVENGTKVLEAQVPRYKVFGRGNGGMGVGGTTWGFPRFEEGEFDACFPFAKVSLEDDDIPMEVSITGWNPFIPGDEDNSGLPAGMLEYSFKNTSASTVSAVFSFNTRNFMQLRDDPNTRITAMKNGFVLHQDQTDRFLDTPCICAIYTDEPETVVDACWFRGGWFDPLTMAWNKVASGDLTPVEPQKGAEGASLFVPFSLKPGESRTITLNLVWYVPHSIHRIGPEPSEDNDYGYSYDPSSYNGTPQRYEPWYAHRFPSIEDVVEYWDKNKKELKNKTLRFTEAFYDTTLPSEVVDAVANNLTILKSPTVMRQHDGRLWVWEGSGDDWGSCHGSCTHVWNYAQAIPHLFPRMERSLRETEFFVDQAKNGHQAFRANIPIRALHHDFHSAADGQLGGLMKVHRDWKISGDDNWLRRIWPRVRESMDYCIRTWDPDRKGALEEPHHNTYDIEFWGPDGMCTSFYAGALGSVVAMGEYLGEDVSEYKALLAKSRQYMTGKLWNGEYFFQDVRWKDLKAGDPTTAQSFGGAYSPEARKILEKEGPKYQYGTGCLSDGVIGCWMSLVCGLDEPVDKAYVTSHLESVYKYNFKHDLRDHANPQRPGYAVGKEGGLLLCTWPRGGKPSLPFVYSDEVWTGIEFQVAAHLIFEGKVEEGLDIVRTVLDRYDGTDRNPFNEYECGSWYARSLSSYSLIQALTGVRYDAVDGTLYIDSKLGNNFRSFLSTEKGYATVGLKAGRPFIEVREGMIPVRKCIVSGKKTKITITQ